jgi:hypothetical protein
VTDALDAVTEAMAALAAADDDGDAVGVAAALGDELDDLEDPSPVLFAPRDPSWVEGAVLRSGEDGAAVAVRLSASPEASIDVAAARRRWPDLATGPRRPGGGAPEATAEADQDGVPFLVVVEHEAGDEDGGAVLTVTVRRNDRL